MNSSILVTYKSADDNYRGEIVYDWVMNKFYGKVYRKRPVDLIFESEYLSSASKAEDYLRTQFGIEWEEVK